MKPGAFGKRTIEGRQSKKGGFGRSGAAAEIKPSANGDQTAKGNGASSTSTGGSETSDKISAAVLVKIRESIPADEAKAKPHSEISAVIEQMVGESATEFDSDLDEGEKRDLVTYLLNEFLETSGAIEEDPLAPAEPNAAPDRKTDAHANNISDAKERVQPLLMEHIDAGAASELPRAELAEQVGEVVGELLVQEKINLNLREQRELVTILLNDMLGLGPLEPLLADESITDIMVNGPSQVYIEQHGKLVLTDVKFRDYQHLYNIATRIVTAVGRRVDETSPICDARLADGSRVNVIIPPLAIDGGSISIRKFAKQKITLDIMIAQNNISENMGKVLKIAGACGLNILISGGTGSGKTTMLNAISKMIDIGERVVTIEDAAELQLQQPHVVRLETRPANLEGSGEVTMRDLVKNALRMRPDRIILGEIRGSEAVDMLQAMNTGHDGSLGTIHANRPREALTRLENMVGLAGINLPSKAVRTQIADALDLVVQVSRMRDGIRRVQYVTEVVGMEGDVITTQDLFTYKFTGEDESGKLTGDFISTGVRPHFMTKAEYFGLGRALMEAMAG